MTAVSAPLQRLPTSQELRPSSAQSRSLGEAVSAVVHAGERLIAQRAELIRLEARNDVKTIGTVVALAVGGGITGLSAVVLAVAAVGVAVVPAIPLAAYLGIVAVVFGGGSGVLLWAARARLPESDSAGDPPKLSSAGIDHPKLSSSVIDGREADR